jgi:phenylacetate-CoA ligase
VNPVYNALPVFAQNLAWTFAGYRRARQQSSAHFHRALDQAERTVSEGLDSHHARQWAGLKQLIERARDRVPYYRFLPPVQECSDPAESIARTLEKIPPLEKTVYRARSQGRSSDFIADDVNPRQLLRFSTSGTTGTALPVWLTAERNAEYDAMVWRQYRSFGVEVQDPWISFGGREIVPLRQRRPPFWRTDMYGQRTLFSIFHMSPENLREYVDAIHALPARYVQGYPSALHLVSRALLQADRPLPPGRIVGVFTSSESLLAFQRESIEKAFSAPVRDHYAATEKVVSMTACAENRLHVDMEFGIVEVESAEETSEYVRGPLLVTGLGRPATPFIRYRIGDVGTRSKTPCPCGRPGDAFLDVDGRIEDYVLTPDDRLVGRLDHVFKEQYEIAEAQIVQNDVHSLDISVVAPSGLPEENRKRLLRDLGARVGDEMDLRIHPIAEIPREPNGKFRAVISSVAKMKP